MDEETVANEPETVGEHECVGEQEKEADPEQRRDGDYRFVSAGVHFTAARDPWGVTCEKWEIRSPALRRRRRKRIRAGRGAGQLREFGRAGFDCCRNRFLGARWRRCKAAGG